MKTLKNIIKYLNLEDLNLLLTSSKKEVVDIVLEQLKYLSRYGKTEKISEEAFSLGKNKFSLEQLKYLSEYSKTDKISERAFNLGKDRFNLKQLEYLSEYGAIDKISKEALKLLDKYKSTKFKIENYL